MRVSGCRKSAVGLILSLFLAVPTLHAARPGDLNGDDQVNITDAIVALKATAGMDLGLPAPLSGDVNGDGKIGIEEALCALQSDARLRNYPTIVPIGNKSVNEGQPLFFTISATDPEGDYLWFFIENLPSGAVFDPYAPSFSWTPTSSQSGTYQVTFLARDTNDYWASETVTITVNEPPLFDAPTYFPLHVGNWWDYFDDGTGTINRTSISGTKSIGGTVTYAVQYAEGDKEYYRSDSIGVRLFGVYILSPEYTGDIFFNPPLLLAPNSAAIGSENVSYSSYPLTLYVYPYGYVTVNIDMTAITRIIALEDVVTQNRVLKDCFKISVQITQVIRETAEIVESETTAYWVYKWVGVVKEIDSTSSVTITASFVNGVSDTY